ncbi:hypothetical protein J4403_00330 [Candidatus Woesearchaeota archaeon]|nr:hypothetical protein [Candidatus Woesearchaeota archaeon]
MIFEENKSSQKFGEKIGYILAYFVFVTILFFILKITSRLPNSNGYLWAMLIVFVIALVGYLIKKLLK